MKTVNKISTLALVWLVVVFTGCKKYLDQQPITQVGPDFVFSDVDNAKKAIAAVYSQLTGDQGYGIRLSLYYTVDNDETQGPTGSADNDRRDMARYTLTPGNAQLSRPFNQIFTGIEYANICIDNLPQMALYTSGSEQQKAQLRRMHGEALTLRAQFYFEAIRNWGDLPEHFKPAYAQASENPFPTRIDRDKLYDKIIADLKIAADLLPWRNNVTTIGDIADERLTKGTAKALRARIALFRGGFSLRNATSTMQRSADYLDFYKIAKEECAEIMASGQHTLNPSYKSLWKDQVGAHTVADPNGELMFQVSGIGLGGTADTKLGYYNGPTVNNLGNRSINILPTYFYQFDSTDLRRDVTCVPYSVAVDGVTKTGTAVTAIVDGKYRRDWVTNPVISPTSAQQYFGLKWQVIRYSDVLLMLAEAENEINGPTATAYNAINMVVRRGHGKTISAADPVVDLPGGLSKSDFFKILTEERSRELGAEGIRKYDLVRWNLLGTKISEVKNYLTAIAAQITSTTPAILPAGCGPYGGIITLPKAMYLITGTTADDKTIWANNFYTASPSSTPAGTAKLKWFDLTAPVAPSTTPTFDILITTRDRFAQGFTPNKSELMPIPQPARDANVNLTQNPGY